MKKILGLSIGLLALTLGTSVLAAPFGSTNLVIYRIGGDANGNTAAALTNRGNIVWLDEYYTNGTFFQSHMLPTNQFGAHSPLIGSGTAFGSGLISRSADGRFIVVAGYGATLGQFTNFGLQSTTSLEAPRVVGLVDGNGNIDTTTTQTNFFSSEEMRSAVSTDGTNIWLTGSGDNQGGVRYTTRGDGDSTRLSSFLTNIRQLNISSNQLYLSSGSGTTRVALLTNETANIPTATNNVFISNLNGTDISSAVSPFGFVLFKLNAGGANPLDTVYVAGAAANRVVKYSLVGTNWVSSGNIVAQNPVGLTGRMRVSGSTTNVDLWITGGLGSFGTISGGENLLAFTDSTGYNGEVSGDANENSIATAAASTRFLGITFAPVGGETAGPGYISVGPLPGLFASGFQGGPFTPSSRTYSLGNPGTSTVSWQMSADVNWLTFSSSNGTLNAGNTNIITVSINANANSLTGGSNYFGIITFTNTTSGVGTTTRLARLAVNSLSVSPGGGFVTSGPPGGPFTGSTVYTITNGSSVAQDWDVSASVSWLDFSATSGTLAALNTTNITVSINASANSLAEDNHIGSISFTNATLDNLFATRTVTLQVGSGFCEEYSTFNEGDLVGQGSWLRHGTTDTLPIQISGGKLSYPSGQTSDNQDAVRAFPTSTSNSVFWGMKVTFTNVPLGTVSYIGGLTTSNQGTITADGTAIAGSFVNYRWSVTNYNNGFIGITARTTGLTSTPFIVGPGTLVTGTEYRVIIQTDPLGSNTTVYVNPTNSNLAGQSPYLVAAPVGTLTGTTPALTVGAVMMSQFGSGSSQTPAVGVSKMCVSTNYGTVYNSLLGTPADPFTTWQNQYFGGTTGNAVAGADPDGDGMSNTNEFLAGFNPTNNAASLRITSATRSGNDIRVTYRGANGNGTTTPPITSRTNVLEFTAGTADRSYSNNFVSTGLTNVLSGGDGSGVVTNFLDVGAAASSTSRYYRVRVIVP